MGAPKGDHGSIITARFMMIMVTNHRRGFIINPLILVMIIYPLILVMIIYPQILMMMMRVQKIKKVLLTWMVVKAMARWAFSISAGLRIVITLSCCGGAWSSSEAKGKIQIAGIRVRIKIQIAVIRVRIKIQFAEIRVRVSGLFGFIGHMASLLPLRGRKKVTDGWGGFHEYGICGGRCRGCAGYGGLNGEIRGGWRVWPVHGGVMVI